MRTILYILTGGLVAAFLLGVATEEPTAPVRSCSEAPRDGGKVRRDCHYVDPRTGERLD